MNVLFIVTAYPRAPGDVITPWLLETIARLRARGVEVEVLAPSYRGLGDQEVEGVRVHRFRYAPRRLETLTHDQTAPDRIRERPWYLALVPGYVVAGRRAARRLTRGGRFDVVHVFWPLPHGLLGMAARRDGGPALVSTFFGVELSWLESQLGFLRPVVRAIVRASDAVTVISSHTAAAVRRVAPRARVRVIPFGAAVRVPDAPPLARERRPGEPYRLLFVGRLVERKGVQVALAAVAQLRDREAVRFTVVGELPRPAGALREQLSACDAFVLPAVRDAKGDVEGLGVVLMEALLYGRPVIASSSGGIVDIVRHEETGLAVTPGDPAALAAAVERYIHEPELAARLAHAGREHVLSAFSWDAITEQLVSVYREVAGAAKEPS